MTNGNFPTGSFGYQDITILAINRKPNMERKGPRNAIAIFAEAGSKSAITNLCIKSKTACDDVPGSPDRDASIFGSSLLGKAAISLKYELHRASWEPRFGFLLVGHLRYSETWKCPRLDERAGL